MAMTQTVTDDRTGVTDVDVVVVGAGFGGLYAIHKLRDEQGLNVLGLDNAGDVGGTWYWNRYPGVRTDSESHAYCYTFDEDLYRNWKWTERYPRREEVVAYFNHVADRFDLRRSIRFNTQVKNVEFNEEDNRWTVETGTGERYRSQFVVESLGTLSAVNAPTFPGQESFKGEIYHTAHWPHEGVDLKGKRVGVIGTGSSGIQTITEIASEVADLYVFQRTAQWVVPAKHGPVDPNLIASIEADYENYWHNNLYHTTTGFGFPESSVAGEEMSAQEREDIFLKQYEHGGGFQYLLMAFNDVATSRVTNKAASDVIKKKIYEIVDDPAVADMLVPEEIYARRPLCCDNYYESFNRNNVHLVDVKSDPICEMTPAGLRTAGASFDLDVIILATGFDAVSGSQLRIAQKGRSGKTLQDKWRDRPRTYQGMMTSGFPNLFFVFGPMGPFTNQPPANQAQVEWICDAIKHVHDTGASTIEPKQAAEQAWISQCDEIAGYTLFHESKSWMTGANIPGKPVTNMFFMAGLGEYKRRIDQEAADAYATNYVVG